MRLVMTLLFISLAALRCEAGVVDADSKSAKFQICRSDNRQKCEGEMFVPCGAEPGALAQITCQKKGRTFFTLAKVKEVPGGQCGSTIYNVECE
jgi:hypothetical protein